MYTFYWYPKCSTCRKAKAVLDRHQANYTEIDLKANPPKAEDFLTWFSQGNFPVKKFFNSSGLVYRELGLKDKLAGLNEQEAAELLASDGMLVKRPLLIDEAGQLLQIGFKEEAYEKELV
ncbi:arsenate reductase family protein [Lactococcus termiticola]|uniref:Arsenate reductase n=1 Tax=Lactococcus termiticola TaxID=2169526 RepID=A0A2R5HH70_9LACT|nr:arsenate reductase family protein [Lactococcus termiticola]GBG96695.1 arsenate reductase [Lactococcus termiticola]